MDVRIVTRLVGIDDPGREHTQRCLADALDGRCNRVEDALVALEVSTVREVAWLSDAVSGLC